ncbi:ATP-binding protein [Halovivax limisalsi]|uniref:ATP-binding protein n=1 Tax=Halovivax limisalsi TaxID=1453760 RepID=UPI001FFCDC37|nr:tetratricopeptide repeat protein [Halovivax limisalsi]
MDEYGVEDLLLLALCERTAVDGASAGATVSELGDAIVRSGSVADRLALLSAMSTVTERGLVDERTERGADLGGQRSLYQLTEAGRRRALERRDAVSKLPVTVHDCDETTECRLGDVPERFGLSVTEALVRRAPSGDLSLPADFGDGIVDRDAERARLDAAFEATLEGDPRTAIVAGDAGVGKTALVEAFTDRVRDAGADVLVGRASPSGGAAYGPLREALGGAIDQPEAMPFADGWAEAEDAEMYRAQLAALYSKVTAVLADSASETPTVLVIEDLQWADAATVDLLAHVAAEVSDAPLLLVATYRSSGLADDAPLGSRLASHADGAATDRIVELALDPFDRERTAELIEAEVERRGVPDSFVDAVYEGTGGNPVFVVETVAGLLESGALDPRVDRYPDAVAEIEIPDVVEDIIERRFAALDGETRLVLDAGAVLGDPIPVDALLAVSTPPEPAVRERCDLLVDGGIWVRDGEDRLRFRSDVLRSTALSAIADERRRSLHGRAAEHLADGESSPPATVASHYERAGERETALEWYRDAAADATAVYAHDVAVEHYETALSLARDLDREETVLDLLEELGDIHATRGQYDEADRQFRYVRERADEPERIRRSYRYQARMAFESGRYDEAETYARDGLAVGGDEITEEVCWLTDYLGSAHFGRGEYEAAIEHHERLRDHAVAIDYTISLGRAHQNLGTCYGQLGEMERAVEHTERGVELFEAAGDDRERASALNDLAVAYNRAGDYDEATRTAERCVDLAERTGNTTALRLAKMNLAVFAKQRGDWDRSQDLFEEIYELAERIDDRDSQALARWNESVTELEIGRVDDAIDGFRTALELARETEAAWRIAYYERGLGAAYVLASAFDRAEAHLENALEIATERDYTQIIAAARSIRGAIARERGEIERALEVQREALELVSDLDDIVRYARMNRLARTLIRAGDSAEALTAARTARDGLPDGNPLVEVKIAATYGAAQLAAGNREAARETLESTVERARDLSNDALVVSLRELGRLEALEGDATAARDRLTEGRRIAAEAGLRVYLPHFDELLGEVEGNRADDGDGGAEPFV